uniref:Uncharacterized protein n=1 Tax=Pararge aegeria TaxID=116150 RepID=S4PRN2_9NEOP
MNYTFYCKDFLDIEIAYIRAICKMSKVSKLRGRQNLCKRVKKYVQSSMFAKEFRKLIFLLSCTNRPDETDFWHVCFIHYTLLILDYNFLRQTLISTMFVKIIF